MFGHKFTSTLFVGAALLLTACSTNPVTGGTAFNLVSEEAEFSLGHDVMKQELDLYGLYDEKPELNAYYHDLGEKIVKISERSDKPFEFLLLDADVFNAGAIPGYIMTYRGILPYMNSEAELVTILGHEVGHISARHTARSISSATLAQVLVVGAAVYGATQADSYAAQGAYILSGVAATIALQSFGRSYENEADTLGIRYLQALGYPPEHAYSVFKAMQIYHDLENKVLLRLNGSLPKKSIFYDVLRSHPEPESRMARTAKATGKTPKLAIEYGEAFGGDPIKRDRYLAMIDGLAYGPSPEEGVIARTAYYNAKGALKLSLPDGYIFRYIYNNTNAENKKGIWRGYNADLKRTLILQTYKTDKKRSSREMMLLSNKAALDIKQETKGDRLVAVGHSPQRALNEAEPFWNRRESGHSVEYMIPLKPDEDGKSEQFLYIKLVAGEDNVRASNPEAQPIKFDKKELDLEALRKDAEEIANSLTELTKEEAKGLQPLRLKVHTVKPGETIAKLADKMAIGDLREDTLRALNGLPDDYEVKPKQKLKIVVDPNQ